MIHFGYLLINKYHKLINEFPSEKTWQDTINHVINVNIINNGTYQHCVHPDKIHWQELSITFVVISPRIYKFFHHNKHQTNPSGRTSYTVTGLYASKMLRTWKTRKDQGTIPNWRTLKRYDNEWNTWPWIE